MKGLVLATALLLPLSGCDIFLTSGNPPCRQDNDCAEDFACAGGVCVELISRDDSPGQPLEKPVSGVNLGSCSFTTTNDEKKTLGCASDWQPDQINFPNKYIPLLWTSTGGGDFNLDNDIMDSMKNSTLTPAQSLAGFTFLGNPTNPLFFFTTTETTIWSWKSNSFNPLSFTVIGKLSLLSRSVDGNYYSVGVNVDNTTGGQDEIIVFDGSGDKKWECSVALESPLTAMRRIPGDNVFVGVIYGGPFSDNIEIRERFCAEPTCNLCSGDRPVAENIPSGNNIASLSVSEGGVLVATVLENQAGNSLRVYNNYESAWYELSDYDGPYTTVAFSHSPELPGVLATGRKDGRVEFFEIDEDPESPAVAPSFVLDAFAGGNQVDSKEVKFITFSPDGQHLAVSNQKFIRVYPIEKFFH